MGMDRTEPLSEHLDTTVSGAEPSSGHPDMTMPQVELLSKMLPPEAQALLAVMAEEMDNARRIVYGMSGRDRAVLSYYLRELSGVVEKADGYRL